MRLCYCLLTAVVACATQPASVTQQPSAQPDPRAIQVMVLGTYHMAGSTEDLINFKADDVLTPARQRQLAAVAAALAKFEPTVIFTERVTDAPEYIDPEFVGFSPEVLASNRNERVQVAYRLAKRAGVTRVHGIDEQPADGEPDYFPFDRLMAHAAKTDQQRDLEALLGRMRAIVEASTVKAKSQTIAERLLEINQGPLSSPVMYYDLAEFDVGESQPAAELHAYWFMRNAKIWSKLRDVVRPGDRAVVVYGAGHKFWLDHLAEQSNGFIRVDPAPYLTAAANPD